MSALIPPTLLGKWLLVVVGASVFNTIQCFVDPRLTRMIYHKAPQQVTPLMARMFGTWTLVSAVIRLCGAYNLDSVPAYLLTMGTFAIALGHFLSEAFIFRTTSLRSPGLVSPLIVASTSLTWMWSMYGEYY